MTKLVDFSSSSDSEKENASSTATPKDEVIQKMYSKGQKNKVAEYARFHSIRATSHHFGVHHKNVARWKKKQVAKIKNPRKRENKKGQGRKIGYPQELEDKRLAWLLEKREVDYVAISTQVIRLKAMSLIQQVNPSFKASDGRLESL